VKAVRRKLQPICGCPLAALRAGGELGPKIPGKLRAAGPGCPAVIILLWQGLVLN